MTQPISKMQQIWCALTITALVLLTSSATLAQDQPLAHYTFSEGQGNVLHDQSGHDHHGTILGAEWTRDHDSGALQFTGKGSYVDFDDNRALKVDGDFSYLAWIKLDPPAYPDHTTNWHLFDCEDYGKHGTMLRIDGAQAKLTYRSSRAGPTPYRFGTTRLDRGGTYLAGFVRRGNTGTLIVDGIPDGDLGVGGDPVYGPTSFKLSSPVQSFAGLIYEVKLFDRALSTTEIVREYWRRAKQLGKPDSRRGKLAIRPHIYDTDKEALFEIDAFGVMPLAQDEHLLIELTNADGSTVHRHEVDDVPPTCAVNHAIDLSELAPGRYVLSAKIVADGLVRAESRTSFDWPSKPAAIPAPTDHVAPPLPTPHERSKVEASVAPGGGLRVLAEGLSLPIESTFSVPNSPEMKLNVHGQAEGGDVTVNGTEVRAQNEHYQLQRIVEARPGRVVVHDTITNLTDQPLGVIFSHRALGTFERTNIAGYEVTPPVERRIRTNPVVYFASHDHGIGIAALDDVLIIQGRAQFDERGISLGSQEFALAPKASYTIQWAVYVNKSGDYYDFINDLRADEGRNSTTVEGTWCTFPESLRRRSPDVIPDKQFFQRRNVAYASLACLSYCTDDPSFSIEGIEFIEYPKERKAVRETIDAIKRTWPHAKTMFHIAPNLYATGSPETQWPDSRIIDQNGRQTLYSYNYQPGNYFTKERLDQGWRCWSYYPALDNTYGKALLDSVDTMMDEMGADGVFVDGCLWNYGSVYSYDRFDGHTADIDPGTGTIQQLKTAIPLQQQHAIVAYGRKIMEKGGVLVANNVYPTRTIAGQPFIFDKEMTEGPEMHLLPTPCTLGNPAAIQSEADVHKDVLSKLAWGNLYFYYGEPVDLQYESAPAHMYPITVDEIRPHYVKGKERIVTAKDDAFGWQQDRLLHFVYRYRQSRPTRAARLRHNRRRRFCSHGNRSRRQRNLPSSSASQST